MPRSRPSNRRYTAKDVRPYRARLNAELLEDRVTPTAGLWYAQFAGMAPGADLDQEAKLGRNLLHSAGIQDQDVSVVGAFDLSGTLYLSTSPDVDQATIESQLQRVPGF